MRTFRITLMASLAGWPAGVVVGTAGGGLALNMIFSVLGWVVILGVARLPGSLFFVAPLVFRALGKSTCWHPLVATCIGGILGIVGLVLCFLVVSLFTTPIHWSREGAGLAALSASTVLAMGATTGCMAVVAARWRPLVTPAPGVSRAIEAPPPLPYGY